MYLLYLEVLMELEKRGYQLISSVVKEDYDLNHHWEILDMRKKNERL